MQLNRLTVRELKDFAKDAGLAVPDRRQTKEEIIDFLRLKLSSRETVPSS
jgi:hypothetical protein